MFGERWGSGPIPEPHNLVCPGFCPDLERVELLHVGRVRSSGAPRVEIADLPWEGGASQFHGKFRGMSPTTKPYNSITDTPCVCSVCFTWGQEADFSARCKLHRMGQQGVQSVGLLHSSRLILHGGECYIQGSWSLHCERGTKHRQPGGCLFSSLPKVTNHILSSHYSSLIYPSFVRA